jgi:hypothetical protein
MSIQTNNGKEQTISNGNPEPIVGNRGASILGPRNVPIERQNPDAQIAPATDAGTVPNFKRLDEVVRPNKHSEKVGEPFPDPDGQDEETWEKEKKIQRWQDFESP